VLTDSVTGCNIGYKQKGERKMEKTIGQKVRLTAQTATYSIMGRSKTVENKRYNQVGTIGELCNAKARVDFVDQKPGEVVWVPLADIELV
jgi:hypothetical protein